MITQQTDTTIAFILTPPEAQALLDALPVTEAQRKDKPEVAAIADALEDFVYGPEEVL